ncbi:MAG: ribonucleoside triphosphate reductase [Clostridiales bacterium]|jgi:ribonucleoside-triphosphate reductase|nr:ribonucleoside triphosphate reductase [Clostridiales bacterium]MDY4655237.1 ribonucleoside triphosphate reductase [Eubacteriales bacterium]
MFRVKKRDGKIASFDINKIKEAIKKAFVAKEIDYNEDIIDMLALKVSADFARKIKDGIVTVEDIQDSVEVVLIQAGYVEVAKSYILYRKQREKIRDIKSTILDYKDVVNNYVKINDWRVKENSTVTYSVGGLILSNSGAVTANYWLSEIYDEEIANAHRNADIHIHDLSMLTGYCAGWSLKQLIKEGLGGIPGKITSSPATHLSTLCNQMVNFLGIMQNEWAGAQAFSSFDTYLAPFVKADNLTYREVKQCIQSFIYGVNTPSRWGTQAPFTNVTLDWVVPNDLAELNAIVGGKEMDFKYKDCVEEMRMVNKAFIEIMIEGDANGRGFQYPIPTYSITRDFDWSETENNRLLFEMTARYGTPYFSNYINSDMEPSDVRSMCCRLRLDLRELRKKSGGFFGSGESTGSVGVVTINMPRIAYLSKDKNEFYERLTRLMDISARSLKVKRDTISKLLENGLYPYTKRYLGTFSNHFSTIGLVGMNEACLNANWIREDLTHKAAQEFTKDVLNFMRNKLSDYQEMYGDLYNLEATPAESTTYRLAKHDKKRYPDIITASENGRTPYYTNSSHLPVGYTEDIFTALDIQDELQTLYTSGTVFHAFLGQKLPDWKAAANLVRKIAENYKLPYYTLSPTYSVCTDHGYIAGEYYECPKCGKKTEVYSRITGYYRPVQNWNDGKREEFAHRKVYNIEHSVLRNSHASSACGCKEESEKAGKELLLFTTKTCPNCKMAKMMLDRAGVKYTAIDAEEQKDLTYKYGVQKAPTLLVPNGDKFDRYDNASEIKRYVEGLK